MHPHNLQRARPPIGGPNEGDIREKAEGDEVRRRTVDSRQVRRRPDEVRRVFVVVHILDVIRLVHVVHVVHGAHGGVVRRTRHVDPDVPMHVLHVVPVFHPRVHVFGRQLEPAEQAARGDAGRNAMSQLSGTQRRDYQGRQGGLQGRNPTVTGRRCRPVVERRGPVA